LFHIQRNLRFRFSFFSVRFSDRDFLLRMRDWDGVMSINSKEVAVVIAILVLLVLSSTNKQTNNNAVFFSSFPLHYCFASSHSRTRTQAAFFSKWFDLLRGLPKKETGGAKPVYRSMFFELSSFRFDDLRSILYVNQTTLTTTTMHHRMRIGCATCLADCATAHCRSIQVSVDR
jgi:hypothetical protein